MADQYEKKSIFCTSYPSKNYQSNCSLCKGDFEDLDFIATIRFKESENLMVQDLFYWDADVTNYLNMRKPRGCATLDDKKH